MRMRARNVVDRERRVGGDEGGEAIEELRCALAFTGTRVAGKDYELWFGRKVSCLVESIRQQDWRTGIVVRGLRVAAELTLHDLFLHIPGSPRFEKLGRIGTWHLVT